MVFSSIPAGFYNLHPASNLQQPPLHHNQRTLHHGSSSSNINPNPPTTQSAPHSAKPVGGPCSIIRPGSMAEKALLENAPVPKAGLECPRCRSTDTKFCYYNNYSLKQPRHKCRGCRRYWTHNGSIRTIPMGGNRRNKRSKPSSSKSALRFSSARTPPHSTPVPLRFAGGHEFGGGSAGLMTNYDHGGININYNNYSDDGIGFVGSMINGPVGEEQWSMDHQLSPVLILPQFPFPGAVTATAAEAAGGTSLYAQEAFEDGQIMHGAGAEE